MSTEKEKLKEAELQRLAEEELLKEARLAAVRVETGGTYGWKKSTLPRTNKIFLSNTIRQALVSNNVSEITAKRKRLK